MMRKAWNLLQPRGFSSLSQHISGSRTIESRVTKLSSQTFHSLPSFLSPRDGGRELGVFHFAFDADLGNFRCRCFSSEPVLEANDQDVALFELLSRACDISDVRGELESLNPPLSHDSILKVLGSLDGSPEVARGFFYWVVENDGQKLSSKSYNLMLGILGRSKRVEEFWNLVEVMKKKGYGVSKNAFLKVSEVFENEGLEDDLIKLKETIAPKPPRISKVIIEGEWSEEVVRKLEDANVKFTSDSVCSILEQLRIYPKKALLFFRWVSGNSLFENDARTYNVMARILGRDDCIFEFWSVVDEMSNAGNEMEMETYLKVFEQFLKKKMIKEAVDLYELKMQSSVKPSALDCVLIMRKIAASNCPDMDLFVRVLKIFTSSGNLLTRSIFDSVVMSLRGAGSLGQCGKFLKAMEDGGLIATTSVHNQVVSGLCKAKNFDEAGDLLVNLEKSGSSNGKLWVSFIEGLCEAGKLDKALYWFQEMVNKYDVDHAGHALEALVCKFCHKERPQDAYKFLFEMVQEKKVSPWHTTYKIMAKSLLTQGHLEEAVSLIGLMKNQGFPPLRGPFIHHISKSYSAEDAITFLNNLSAKRVPSTSVFVQMFKAFSKAGRLNEAHDLLSLCPNHIRGHADVLEFFHSINSGKGAVVPA